MTKLLNRSLRRFIQYAALVLACSIPVYYFIFNGLWQYEMAEHNIVITETAGREDRFIIIGTVTALTVLFFGLLLAGLVLLNRRVARRLWRPFYDSLDKIRDFDLKQQEALHFEPTDIEEFSELNKNLEKLLSSTVAAYNQQKEFADNASHELQTPLSIVQSKLDLLLQSQSLTTGQYHIIEDAHKALTRVGRINKNLLLLTRIDNNQYGDEEPIDLAILLSRTIDVFTSFAETKQINLQSHIPGTVTIKGNRALVEILINNLLNNAIRHSAPGATVHIRLSQNSLVFTNPGKASLNRQQLFKRFGTVSDSPGTGLGLALSKQIAERYGWKLEYSYEEELHTFSLLF